MAEQVKAAGAKPRLGRGLSSLIVNSAEVIASPVTPVTPADLPKTVYVPVAAPAGGPHQPVAVPTAAAVQVAPARAATQVASEVSATSAAPKGDAVAPGTDQHKQPVATEADGPHQEIAVSKIAPNPYQPRREFNAEDLAELAASIKEQGILQPLVVAPAADATSDCPFVLIAGERRLRASRLAGLTKVPCIIKQATRQQMLEWALIENVQRTDLNPVERAVAYRDYMDRFNLSVADAAQRMGQPRTTVANYLRILDLCDDVQKLLLEGTLTFGHAKVLAGLAGQEARQVELAKRIVAETLSVRQLETLAAISPQQEQAPPQRTIHTKAAYLRDLEDQLTRAVGTRVTIMPGRAKHTGRLVIDYYSLDDFDRFCSALGLKVES